MIIGSGLLARSFESSLGSKSDVCVYAAGVSNSGCNDTTEFYREQLRLTEALSCYSDSDLLFILVQVHFTFFFKRSRFKKA